MTTEQIEAERKRGTTGLFWNHDTGQYVELPPPKYPHSKFPEWNTPEFRKIVEILRDLARETNYKGLPKDSFWRPHK